MFLNDVNWDYVDRVSDVDQSDSSIVIHYLGGGCSKVFVPMSLMQAMIARGEQNYIDQDIERSEWDPNRPD